MGSGREGDRRAQASAVVALALALLLGGCATADAGAAARPEGVFLNVPANPLSAGGLQDPRIGGGVEHTQTAGPPARIRIPSIGVDSALEDLGLGQGGRLNAPVDYDLAGWYSGGVVPGSIGPAIIAGHVDSPTAPAVFARIEELIAGDAVLVTMTDGSELTFLITGSMQSAKSNFPTGEVYSNVPAPELRLITCAGEFDSSVGHYSDNLIVFAALGG